jgi:hypothetical protein
VAWEPSAQPYLWIKQGGGRRVPGVRGGFQGCVPTAETGGTWDGEIMRAGFSFSTESTM